MRARDKHPISAIAIVHVAYLQQIGLTISGFFAQFAAHTTRCFLDVIECFVITADAYFREKTMTYGHFEVGNGCRSRSPYCCYLATRFP